MFKTTNFKMPERQLVSRKYKLSRNLPLNWFYDFTIFTLDKNKYSLYDVKPAPCMFDNHFTYADFFRAEVIADEDGLLSALNDVITDWATKNNVSKEEIIFSVKLKTHSKEKETARRKYMGNRRYEWDEDVFFNIPETYFRGVAKLESAEGVVELKATKHMKKMSKMSPLEQDAYEEAMIGYHNW